MLFLALNLIFYSLILVKDWLLALSIELESLLFDVPEDELKPDPDLEVELLSDISFYYFYKT